MSQSVRNQPICESFHSLFLGMDSAILSLSLALTPNHLLLWWSPDGMDLNASQICCRSFVLCAGLWTG
jgi:hypothetical protein